MRILPENPPFCEEFIASIHNDFVSFELGKCADLGFTVSYEEKANVQYNFMSETFHPSYAYLLSNALISETV